MSLSRHVRDGLRLLAAHVDNRVAIELAAGVVNPPPTTEERARIADVELALRWIRELPE